MKVTFRQKIQKIWDISPKEFKVFTYIVASAFLETVVKALNIDVFTFVPVTYRLAVYNLVVVILVEMAKRLKGVKNK